MPASERELNLHLCKPCYTLDTHRQLSNQKSDSLPTLPLRLWTFFSHISMHHPCKYWQKCHLKTATHMCFYTYICCSHASKNSAAYLYLFSSWNLSDSRRVTGGVQCALYQTARPDRGRLELSSGILPFCKLTSTHSCRFNGFGHSAVKSCRSERAFCVSCVFELLYIYVCSTLKDIFVLIN